MLWSGNGTNGRIITDLEFQPDLVWIKCRSNDPSHKLFDVIRGGGKVVESDDNSAEETNQEYGYLSAFNTCLLYTSPSPRDVEESRMPSSA